MTWWVRGIGYISLVIGLGGLHLHDAAAVPRGSQVPESPRSIEVRRRQLGTVSNPGPLAKALRNHGFQVGNPVFIRIFKQMGVPRTNLRKEATGQLEIWIRRPNFTYDLFKSYPIAKVSGQLGPKEREGDFQAPEGFYAVSPDSMNPNSDYHLSMNVGYPNDFDLSPGLDRTGSLIMIHGREVSIGCFAMTDPGIEEIYMIVEAALLSGQSAIPIHIFPFPMNSENMNAGSQTKWADFWRNLQDGYEIFENYRVPPKVSAKNGRYEFTVPAHFEFEFE